MLHFQHVKADLFEECMKPFELYDGLTVVFEPIYETGDHAYLSRISGNAVSGYLRCFGCDENWSETSDPERKSNNAVFKKSLKEIIKFLKNGNLGNKGILRIPGKVILKV
jgi:hypothetical protein